MSKESKDLAAKAQWDSKRVLSLVVNNALMIIMIIAAIAIATLRSRHCFIAGKCSIFFQHSETCRRKISRNIYGLTSVLTMSNH